MIQDLLFIVIEKKDHLTDMYFAHPCSVGGTVAGSTSKHSHTHTPTQRQTPSQQHLALVALLCCCIVVLTSTTLQIEKRTMWISFFSTCNRQHACDRLQSRQIGNGMGNLLACVWQCATSLSIIITPCEIGGWYAVLSGPLTWFGHGVRNPDCKSGFASLKNHLEMPCAMTPHSTALLQRFAAVQGSLDVLI